MGEDLSQKPTSLSPRNLARALGVSESSVKRWVDSGAIEATKTAGGHRKIAVSEAVRYVREHGVSVIHPELLGFDLETRLDASVAGSGEQLKELLIEGKRVEARSLLLSWYLSGNSLANVVDGPLAEAMGEIGKLYLSCGHEGVYIEHRSTEVVAQGLREILATLPSSNPGAVAIGCSVSGDYHTLPTLAVSVVLRSVGIAASSLGANLPLKSLELAIQHYDPRLVWVSISHVTDAVALQDDFAHLIPILEAQDRFLIVGGCNSHLVELPTSPAICRGARMGDLVTFATAVMSGRES